MSVVCILTPVVIASWPAFSSAVVAAAASLGYTAVDAHIANKRGVRGLAGVSSSRAVDLEIAQSELVTDSLDRGQQISVSRDGVIVTFSRDARGKAALRVEGCGHEEAILRALGEELSQRVVQKYVYQRLMDEMKTRNFLVVEEEVNEDASIRLKVRHWDN
jgi:hypothetical protein